jgi:Glycogen recognition site of AMP-activated protein kinase
MRDIENNSRDDEFAERIAQPLRAPEVLAPDFEARLMAQARAELARRRALPARRNWLTTRRMYAISPLTGLALAAGIAVIVAASTLGLARRPAPAVTVAATHDTVELVRFVFADSSARTVSLVGDFNGWARDKTPLHATARAGVWSVSVPLVPGRHEYAFIVNGKRWVADPLSPANRDEFGTESSILMLASTDAS